MPQLGGAWGTWPWDMHFLGHEGAEATFPRWPGAGPCAPAAWRGPEGGSRARGCTTPSADSQEHSGLLSGGSEQLSGERASCQPSEGMKLGPEAAATPHWQIDTPLPRTEALGASARSTGFALESAPELQRGNEETSVCCWDRWEPRGARGLGWIGARKEFGQCGSWGLARGTRHRFVLLRDLNRTSKCWD